MSMKKKSEIEDDVDLFDFHFHVCSSVFLGSMSSDNECCTDVISKQTGGYHDNSIDAGAGLMQPVVHVTCSDMTSPETDAEGIAYTFVQQYLNLCLNLRAGSQASQHWGCISLDHRTSPKGHKNFSEVFANLTRVHSFIFCKFWILIGGHLVFLSFGLEIVWKPILKGLGLVWVLSRT